MLIQEWWILRPLLSVIGFDLYGPAEGSEPIDDYHLMSFSYTSSPGTPAVWIQRLLWGAVVRRGGAFALLRGWLSRTSDRNEDQTEDP